ncbi:MAG: iron-sulfur cluster assembly accessory protein [Armatimonadetes bacterium]|nr:iron-sulfur cluster assembly accessory protein [Armatimonadota bacterium]
MESQRFPVDVSPEAVDQLKRLKERKGSAASFVRLGVKGGGCSGLEYVLRLDETPLPVDITVEMDGLTLACDSKSAKFLAGSKLMWTGNLIGGGFSFENPNAQRSCGCGTSFTPKSA